MSDQASNPPSLGCKPEQNLSSFASLLSSALTVGGAEPLAGSATALPCFISSTLPDSEPCASLPGLSLRTSSRSSPPSSGEVSTSLEEATARKLSSPIICTKSDLEAAPGLILRNVSASYSSLIDSRLRSSLSALVRRALCLPETGSATGEDIKTKVLVGILSAGSQSPVTLSTVVTSFRVLPLSDRDPSGGVILPLVFEAIVDLSILGTTVTVPLRSPGTMNGTFDHRDGLIRSVEVTFDTMSFLQSMMKQARFAVRKAVTIAAGIVGKLVQDPMGSGTRRFGIGGMTLPPNMLQSTPDMTSAPEQSQANGRPNPQSPQSDDGTEDEITERPAPSSPSPLPAPKILKSKSFTIGDSPPPSNGESSSSNTLMPPPPRRPSCLRSMTDLAASVTPGSSGASLRDSNNSLSDPRNRRLSWGSVVTMPTSSRTSECGGEKNESWDVEAPAKQRQQQSQRSSLAAACDGLSLLRNAAQTRPLSQERSEGGHHKLPILKRKPPQQQPDKDKTLSPSSRLLPHKKRRVLSYPDLSNCTNECDISKAVKVGTMEGKEGVGLTSLGDSSAVTRPC